MSLPAARSHRRLRVPAHTGGVLLEPPRERIGERLRENREEAGRLAANCGDATLGQLRGQARRELLQAAWRYTSAYRDAGPLPPEPATVPLILSGHQPELFHPGVWFKNFLLADLAREHRAVGVNLLIDNDTCRSASLRVPTGSLAQPRVTIVPFDTPSDAIPYEERGIREADTFASFPSRVRDAIASLVPRPLVTELWPHALASARGSSSPSDDRGHENLGQALARARNRLEASWGVDNWELPLSHACRGAAFRRFLAHLLIHAERLRRIYNRRLAEYRRANRVRSQSHPVPALERDDGWVEVPFWIWSREDPSRRRLFARPAADGLEVTDRHAIRRTLSVGEHRVEGALEQLAAWETEGIRVRPRALTTTMFARLILSDLFVHGIGGAKYDELTDAILAEFFQVQPPHYVIATATMRLPFPVCPSGAETRLRELDRELRDLRFHPENFLPPTPDIRPLLESKRQWIFTRLPRGQRKPRHEAIRRVNEALQPHVRERREQCLESRQALQGDLRRQRLLASREFSFCLFPADSLRESLLELSRQGS